MSRRPAAQVLRVDPDGHLSDGLVIETSLLAKIFGLRVLRIEGTVSVAPAQVRNPSVPVVGASVVTDEHPHVLRAPPGDPPRPAHLGSGLATAADLLRDARSDLRGLPERDTS